MDQQPKPRLQRIFWRENQVTLTFHSNMNLVSDEGINTQSILRRLRLDDEEARNQVLNTLNQYLEKQGVRYTLSFFSEKDGPSMPVQPQSFKEEQKNVTFKLPPGMYIFGLNRPIASDYGEVKTSVIAFFHFTAHPSSASETAHAPKSEEGQRPDPVVTVVNALKRGRQALNAQGVQVSAAEPVVLFGGTPLIPQGCPLTPAMPLKDSSCSYWHYTLPHLTPKELRQMKGEGVTVLILDTLPEQQVIADAVQEAGDDNLLLQDVSNAITYNYNFLSPGIEIAGSDHIAVGKDVYGRHIIVKHTDHGLFTAGIVHDIAPKASIECIRVLDDYCVGDSNMFLNALQYIESRMVQGGDLYQKLVVINMSLVIPTQAEMQAEGLQVNVADPNDVVVAQLRLPMKCLSDRGAIVTASAGNDFDERDNPAGKRPPALYPAAFAYAPDSMDGVIPVGAVDKHGKATSYSNYPGSHGIATYGGELPHVDPPQPDPNKPLHLTDIDAVRGIYTAEDYPSLVAPQPPAPEFPVPVYPAPDHHAWASWVGTSFATPVVTGLVARILEMKLKGAAIPHVRDAVLAASGTETTNWDKLDPSTGVSSGNAVGPMIQAGQTCMFEDEDDEDDDGEFAS